MNANKARWTALQVTVVLVELVAGIVLAPITIPLGLEYEARMYLRRRRQMAQLRAQR